MRSSLYATLVAYSCQCLHPSPSCVGVGAHTQELEDAERRKKRIELEDRMREQAEMAREEREVIWIHQCC